MMENYRTSSRHDYAEDYFNENFPPHNYGEDHPKETFSTLKNNLAIATEGPTEIIQDPVSTFKGQ